MTILGFASRAFAGLLWLGFALVPPFVVFHFLGWEPAVAMFVIELAATGVCVRRLLRQRRQSLMTFLSTSVESFFEVHPLIVSGVSAVAFLLPGIWMILSADAAGMEPDAMTTVEQRWFGTIFCLLGAGLGGFSVTKWLENSFK